MSPWRGRPPVSVDGGCPSPTALLGVDNAAAALAIGVADPLIATAPPIAAASRNFVEPSFSVAFDALLYAYGYLPLVDSAALGSGVAAGVRPGYLRLGSE